MRRTLAVLFALAVAVRIGAAVATGIGGPPVEDERGYVLLAESLADSGTLRLPVPPEVAANARVVTVREPLRPPSVPPPRRSFRSPGLPVVLAPLAAAGGGPFWMRVFSILAGSLGAPLFYVALRPLLRRRAAAWTAAVYAAWPPAVYLSLRVLSEPLSQTVLLGAVALAVRDGDGRVGRPGWAGLVAGLSVLVRSAALLPAFLLGAAAGSGRRRAAFVLLFVAALAPWVARNALLHGRPLLTTNSGVTLVGGNCDAAAQAVHPGKWVAPDRAYAGRDDAPDFGMWGWSDAGEGASDLRFSGDAGEWVAAHPGRAARLALWKVVRLFDPDPRSAKTDAGMKRVVGWMSLTPVLLLALLGLPAAWRDRRRWAPWLLLWLGTVTTAVVFYGDARMRTTADPSLLALAAAGAAAARNGLRRRRGGTGTPGVASE